MKRKITEEVTYDIHNHQRNMGLCFQIFVLGRAWRSKNSYRKIGFIRRKQKHYSKRTGLGAGHGSRSGSVADILD